MDIDTPFNRSRKVRITSEWIRVMIDIFFRAGTALLTTHLFSTCPRPSHIDLARLLFHYTPPLRTTVVAADSLIKRDILRVPDPFAIVSVDGEQIHTTSVIKRTLNPYWNE